MAVLLGVSADALRALLDSLDALAAAEARGAPEREVIDLADRITLARLTVAQALVAAGWQPPEHYERTVTDDGYTRRLGIGGSALLDP